MTSWATLSNLFHYQSLMEGNVSPWMLTLRIMYVLTSISLGFVDFYSPHWTKKLSHCSMTYLSSMSSQLQQKLKNEAFRFIVHVNLSNRAYMYIHDPDLMGYEHVLINNGWDPFYSFTDLPFQGQICASIYQYYIHITAVCKVIYMLCTSECYPSCTWMFFPTPNLSSHSDRGVSILVYLYHRKSFIINQCLVFSPDSCKRVL